jgi:alpha/beta superfamily hydrolase
MRVMIQSTGHDLEGDLLTSVDSPAGAVVCHPHPLYGGSMENPVVLALVAGLRQAGLTTLRFNFRGVGRSTGEHGNGVAECEDLRAATSYLLESTSVERVVVAGYSFGAAVALTAGPTIPSASAVVAVAPPVSLAALGKIRDWSAAKLILTGDRDPYCETAALTQWLATVAEPKKHLLLTGADHFLAGFEDRIAESVARFSMELDGFRRPPA